MSEAYICSALRTPGGRRGGKVSGWHPVDLAARAEALRLHPMQKSSSHRQGRFV